MCNTLEEILNNKIVYDFKPEYKREMIEKIKDSYIKKCNNSNKITDEFKSYISNKENISVTVNYGWDLYVSFANFIVPVTYEYKFTYETNVRYVGTGTIDSSGNISTSGLNRVSDWKSDYNTYKTQLNFSTNGGFNGNKYESHVGDNYYNESKVKNYVLVDNLDTCPPELAKLVNGKLPKTIDKMVQGYRPPKLEVEKRIKETNSTARNIVMGNISNYSFDEAQLYYFPISFTLSVDYKGKRFEQTVSEDGSDTKPDGELTKHYSDFESYYDKIDRRKAVYLVPFLISLIGVVMPVLGFILFAVTDPDENSLVVRFKILGTIFSLISYAMIIPCGRLSYALFKEELEWHESKTRMYNINAPLSELYSRLDESYRKCFLKNILIALGIIALGMLIGFLFWFI